MAWIYLGVDLAMKIPDDVPRAGFGSGVGLGVGSSIDSKIDLTLGLWVF
jgi:hypothetical protein